MPERITKYSLFFLVLILAIQCKKPYQPAAIVAKNNYLVVDGFINTATNSITSVKLSRTRNLYDTVTSIPELQAQVTIESKTGTTYSLFDQQGEGRYVSSPLSLDNSLEYRLMVKTADGSEYASEFVAPKITPPIDSITWQQNNDVHIYVNTHDPDNNTRYYRWNFTETWEYRSQLEAELGLKDDTLIYYADATNEVHVCYTSDHSTDILLGSSAALSRDVISQAPIATIIQNNDRIVYRYSILVQQYALTAEAYRYWQIIQKNTQQLGTLFDLQPAQLVGNIHSLSDAGEPVIGFVSATAAQQKRIFINHSELTNWVRDNHGDVGCPMLVIYQNPDNYLVFHYPDDPTLVPYYFGNGYALTLTKRECLDCTLQGGTRVKPDFW